MTRDFKLGCDIVSFSFFLPFIIGSKQGTTQSIFLSKICWETKLFLQLSKNNFLSWSTYLIQPWKFQLLHLHLRMSQTHLNVLSSASNWRRSLKPLSHIFHDCSSCIWSPHCSLEIKNTIHTSFNFLKSVTVATVNFYTLKFT